MLAKKLEGAALATQPAYIEDVFSTWLYTGNGSTQTITNGIDLAGKGGMVWIKSRSAATNNFLFDTLRGTTDELNSNTTDAEASLANSLTAFNADGFSIGSATGIGVNAATYASWTFRKQPKFFDVVTYTGNGSSQNIAHNLGSVPGCIIVKSTSTVNDWRVYHRSLATVDSALRLNSTAAAGSSSTFWNSTAPTSTQFTVGSDGSVNANGGTYVAYLFAHDAGGFGLSGADNVISCGSYTGNGSATGPMITLGYEPQYVMVKRAAGGTGGWYIFDNMRDFNVTGRNDFYLQANLSDAETFGDLIGPTSTGFQMWGASSALNVNGNTYIYIAIRRGPMKTPTSGTSVFAPVARGSAAIGTSTGISFPPDMSLGGNIGSTNWNHPVADRLRGVPTFDDDIAAVVYTNATTAENGSTFPQAYWTNQTAYWGSGSGTGAYVYFFRRAPGFFDVVCYTGNSNGNRQVTHNLGVTPDLLIVKKRSGTEGWFVLSSALLTDYGKLETTAAFTSSFKTDYFGGNPTATYFVTGSGGGLNDLNATYVAYLFATCAGVSKVGSYTGSGTTKQIDCGFTGGARFVLIKRTDSTGDWYVWDSTRGIVAGNDPYLLLNSTAAEVTNTDYIDTYSAGFEISSTAPAAINANGGTFIFLAVA